MSKTVRVFEMVSGEWKATRKAAGVRRSEWNKPNRKIARAIRRRQSAYDAMVNNPKYNREQMVTAYHRPGAAS